MYWPSLRRSLPKSEKGRAVLKQLDNSADLLEVARRLQSILLSAVRAGDAETVRLLYNCAVNPNVADENGQTVLMIAAGQGHAEIVKILLAHEWEDETMVMTSHYGGATFGKPAEVDARDSRGSTALIAAATHGHAEVVQLLLDAGAKVNAATERGLTAIMQAAMKGQVEAVKVLLAAGAEVNAAGNFECNTALMRASKHNRRAVIELLLASGADIHAVDSQACTALLWAAKGCAPEAAELLLAHGADVNAADHKGWTALHRTCMRRSRRVLHILLDAGADVNAKAHSGVTALEIVAGCDLELFIHWLIKAGADVNAQNDRGITALMAFAKTGSVNLGTAEALLAAGADARIKDESGKTAADYARAEQRASIAEYFEQARGTQPGEP